jgi:hypothetical protein
VFWPNPERVATAGTTALRLNRLIVPTQGSREARHPWALGRNRFAVEVPRVIYQLHFQIDKFYNK